MLMGAIIGAIVGAVMWFVFAAQAKGRSTVDALGPNPALREAIEVSLTPSQVLDRLHATKNPQYAVEPSSTPEAIILRRPTDLTSYGYAFLIKTNPVDPARTRLLIHVASLASIQKKILPKHYEQFRAFLDGALR